MREFALTFAVGAFAILLGLGVVWVLASWPLLLLVALGVLVVYFVGNLVFCVMEDTW